MKQCAILRRVAARAPPPLHLDNRSAAERSYERDTLNPAGLR